MVIFVTILFGVIALSFIRIILSENTQSSNDDLSQSALDSALVGVEDAKRAVNQYYQCVNASGDSATCGSLFGGNCDDFRLKTYLYGDTYPGEVLVQESTSNNADQAYTCVILANRVPDYRSTLTSDTRTRVIPLGIGSTSLSEVKSVTFRWYSEINGTDFRLNSDGKLGAINNATTPPTLTLSLLKKLGRILILIALIIAPLQIIVRWYFCQVATIRLLIQLPKPRLTKLVTPILQIPHF